MTDNLPDVPGAGHGQTWTPPSQLDVVRYLGAYSRALDEATQDAERISQEYAEAKRDYRVAYARAFLSDGGTVKDREQKALLEAADEQFRAESLEQQLKAARERIETLRTQISTGQSIGAGIRAEMGLGGWSS